MTIDATFWVAISFFIFLGILIYFKIPQKIKITLEENISKIKNQINVAEKLKEEAKNILSEHEKKISNSKAEVKSMINKANENAVVLLDNNNNPLGTRIVGPLTQGIKKAGLTKILNMSLRHFLNGEKD